MKRNRTCAEFEACDQNEEKEVSNSVHFVKVTGDQSGFSSFISLNCCLFQWKSSLNILLSCISCQAHNCVTSCMSKTKVLKFGHFFAVCFYTEFLWIKISFVFGCVRTPWHISLRDHLPDYRVFMTYLQTKMFATFLSILLKHPAFRVQRVEWEILGQNFPLSKWKCAFRSKSVVEKCDNS